MFARILIEMFKQRPPDLVIMDAVISMCGYGPASSDTYHAGKILASDDVGAMDVVEANMIGFKPEEVPFIMLAREMNLSETHPKNIEVVGDGSQISDYPKPEELPANSYSYKAGMGSGSTSRVYYRQRVAFRPVIDPAKCKFGDGCRECIQACPAGALAPGDGGPALSRVKCILCSACKEVCQYQALDLPRVSKLYTPLSAQTICGAEINRTLQDGLDYLERMDGLAQAARQSLGDSAELPELTAHVLRGLGMDPPPVMAMTMQSAASHLG